MYDKTVSFLASALSYLPNNSPSVQVIKSHYITKCRDAQYDKQVTLSRSDFGPHKLCKNCGNPWQDTAKLRITPKKKPSTKKQELILAKYAKPGSKLAKFQARIKKEQTNKLLRICTYCSYKSVVDLKPPEATAQSAEKIAEGNTPKSSKPKLQTTKNKKVDKSGKLLLKKKKKKKKDKFAGLNVSAVRQAVKTPTQTPQTSDQIKKITKAFKDNQSNKFKKSLLSLLK